LGCAGIAAGEPAASGTFTVRLDRPKQVIWGLGFEIQSDSIGSGNHGLPEEPVAVPHDLVPSERERLADEMLKNFRYCRLAGGLYWRGLDAEGKQLRPRWPEQLVELRALLERAGVEGLSFEYWSPAPYWKANRAYVGAGGGDEKNRLRCFAPGFENDPDYRGDTDRFLADFARAVVGDIATLRAAGLKTVMWGLQNEPFVSNGIYSTCRYPDSPSYVRAYRAVASAIRKHDPKIVLFADTESSFPKKIAPGMSDPEVAKLVDAYVVHTVGSPSENVRSVDRKIRAELPPRPWWQNEYEYLTGGATPDRCLNTVQHIMNSFQLAENPTWFWIHALKPLKNAEASGYALGFWRSLMEKGEPVPAERMRRWPEGPEFTRLPEALRGLEMVSAKRGKPDRPGIGYSFSVNQPVTVYLLSASGAPGNGWEPTGETAAWDGGSDAVFKRAFPKGKVEIPSAREPGVPPHLALVEPSDKASFKAQIGMNLPIEVRSEAIALQRRAAGIRPGHWIFNPYNWNAVGSFVRRMPWDSVAVDVEEGSYDAQGRVFAFKKPGGKLAVVLSNRSAGERRCVVQTGLAGARWAGFRYTPDEAGPGTMGVPAGGREGATIEVVLPGQSWEFWEQQ
jgi:hypothetical protein